jgi:hypothetical protein
MVAIALPATRGVIDGQAVYTLDAIRDRLDITDAWLRTARRRGLRVRYAGRRAFVIGSDFISYLAASQERLCDQ